MSSVCEKLYTAIDSDSDSDHLHEVSLLDSKKDEADISTNKAVLMFEAVAFRTSVLILLITLFLSAKWLALNGGGNATSIFFFIGMVLTLIPAVARWPLTTEWTTKEKKKPLMDDLISERKKEYTQMNRDKNKTFFYDYPKVRVMIPCVNEPFDIVSDTLMAACNIQYPKNQFQVCLCDDGGRSLLENWCKEQGIQNLHYFARKKEKNIPHHAKAGNLNVSMEYFDKKLGKVDYVLYLDCDMIPTTDALQRVIPHFDGEENLAFVQTRDKMFYNLIGADIIANHGSFHCDILQVCNGEHGAAFCCGTGCVWSVECLDKIGGWTYNSVTEDFNTTLTAWLNGYRSYYLNETICFGLAPVPIGDVYKQRMRWMYGPFQVIYRRFFDLFLTSRPFGTFKMTFQQRMLVIFMTTCQTFGRVGQLFITISLLTVAYTGKDTKFEARSDEQTTLEYAIAGCLGTYLGVQWFTKLLLCSSRIHGTVGTFAIASLSEIWETLWCLPYFVEQMLSSTSLNFQVTSKSSISSSTTTVAFCTLFEFFAALHFCGAIIFAYDQFIMGYSDLGEIARAVYIVLLLVLFGLAYSIPTIYSLASTRWEVNRKERVDYSKGYPVVIYVPPEHNYLSIFVHIFMSILSMFSFSVAIYSFAKVISFYQLEE